MNIITKENAVLKNITFYLLTFLLLAGLAIAGAGLFWSAAAFWQWREAGFGALDPRVVMRDTIPAAALMVGGMEIMLAAFLLSVLGLQENQ